MVEHVLAKDETGVRFSLAAQNYECPLVLPYILSFFVQNVDNYVSNVYKGHILKLSFEAVFVKNMLKNKGFMIKDTKI